MNELSFNTVKLEEVYDAMTSYYNEYKETTTALEQEIKQLETTWGKQDQSLYQAFKEKYEEKKSKLIETENMMKELLNTLEQKKEAIMQATISSENSFE